MKPKITVKLKEIKTDDIVRSVDSEMNKAVKALGQDFARASSGATPHLTGELAGSYSYKYDLNGDKKTVQVSYTAMNNGFNYAVAMHEWTYKLGDGSRAKGGGIGMSGKSYPVGNKFMTRVLEGEEEAYRDYVGKRIKKVIK